MFPGLFAGVLLLVLLVVALGQDLAARRISNRVVLIGLLAGLACQGLLPAGDGLFLPQGGSLGLVRGFFGMLVAGGLLLPLYLLRAMGAGDVKLAGVVGVFLGPWQAIGAVLLIFLAGGFLALVVAVGSRSLTRVADNLRVMFLYLRGGRSAGFKLADAPTSGRLPYALAILCGSILQIWLARIPGWPFV